MKFLNRVAERIKSAMHVHDWEVTRTNGYYHPSEEICWKCGEYRHKLLSFDAFRRGEEEDWISGKLPRPNMQESFATQSPGGKRCPECGWSLWSYDSGEFRCERCTWEGRLDGRGGKRLGAGRKPSGKVRLQCWIDPETKAALGPRPGIKIDELMREQSPQTSPHLPD